MQNITKKDPTQSSVHSTSPCIVNSPLWWNSIGSQIPQSSLSKSLTLRMDSPPQHCIVKQFGQLQEQDSSSTQSTGQSQHDVSAMGEGNPRRQCISAQSGFVENYRKQTEGHLKSVASLGNPNFAFPSSQIDYSPSVVRIPYPCADPHVNGLLAVYGPQAIIHPQMVGMTPARIPLPLDLAEDEPIYVNAKQYHAILRRRQCRANFEAQNKLAKARKPYLHESRHRHALNRVRGSGGRFLNTKKLQQSKPSATIEGGMNALDSAHLQLGGNMSESEVLQSENGSGGASATSSDVTSVSNGDDIFQQPDTSFSTYPPRHMSRTMHGGAAIMCNGSQHRVSVMR